MSVRLFPELLCSVGLDSFIHKKHSNNDVNSKEWGWISPAPTAYELEAKDRDVNNKESMSPKLFHDDDLSYSYWFRKAMYGKGKYMRENDIPN